MGGLLSPCSSLRRPSALAGLLAASLSGCWVTTDKGRALEADIVKLKAEFSAEHKEYTDESAKAEHDREKLREEEAAALKRMDAKLQEVTAAMEQSITPPARPVLI